MKFQCASTVHIVWIGGTMATTSNNTKSSSITWKINISNAICLDFAYRPFLPTAFWHDKHSAGSLHTKPMYPYYMRSRLHISQKRWKYTWIKPKLVDRKCEFLTVEYGKELVNLFASHTGHQHLTPGAPLAGRWPHLLPGICLKYTCCMNTLLSLQFQNEKTTPYEWFRIRFSEIQLRKWKRK